MPAHVLVLDAAEGISPGRGRPGPGGSPARWSRRTPRHSGAWTPSGRPGGRALEEVERWAPVLGRLGDGPTAVPVLGMASRDASVDVTPALALGVTDLLTLPVQQRGPGRPGRVLDAGRRSGRGLTGPSPPRRWPSSAPSPRPPRRRCCAPRRRWPGSAGPRSASTCARARESLSHSLQVILGTMIGSAEAAGPDREGHSRRVASITRDLTDSSAGRALRVRGMELAGLFLDIGMLVLPSDLLAPRGLEPDAVELLHGHADLSGDILEPLARVGLPVAAVGAHHERLDGPATPAASAPLESPSAPRSSAWSTPGRRSPGRDPTARPCPSRTRWPCCASRRASAACRASWSTPSSPW